jgi:hypothetical protein
MTSSQPDTTDLGPDTANIKQMGRDLVASLCFEALRIAGSSARVKSAVEDFKESLTPWDGTELGNAIWSFDPGHPDVATLVETIDREAEACAGLPLPNRKVRA